MNSLSSLDILAIVAEKEQPSTTITMPMSMSEKKPLPFNLNLKPRTNRKPHSSPIDIHALLPCLDRKRKLYDHEIQGINDFKKMRLTIRLGRPVPPKLPLEYQRKIAELGGSDVRLVIQKRIRKSDVKKKKKGRLIMPYRECQVDFGAIQEMLVKVVQPANMLSEMILSFQSWYTKSSSYVLTGSSSYVLTGSSSYVLTGSSWNHLVEVNDLQIGDVVQVWSFRQGDELSFALIKL